MKKINLLISIILILIFTGCSLFVLMPKKKKEKETGEPVVQSYFMKRWTFADGNTFFSINADKNNSIVFCSTMYGNVDINGDGDYSDEAESTSSPFQDIFLSKFDTSGNVIWAKRLKSENNNTGILQSISIDKNNDIIVTGCINKKVDLNGDNDFLDAYESGNYDYDIIIIKFNSFGNFLWAKRLGNENNYYQGFSIAVDNSSNIIVTGMITGKADLNGDGDFSDDFENSINTYNDIFISKFNSNGNFNWSKRLAGGTSYSITTDNDNNIIVTGYTYGNADLDGDGIPESTGYGLEDIFISKFDSYGDFKWSKRLGGSGQDYGYSIATDNDNNIIITGKVYNNADLNGDGDSTDGSAESNFTFQSIGELFISKFNSSGDFQWAKRIGSYPASSGNSIITDNSNNVIVAGCISNGANLDGDGVGDISLRYNSQSFYLGKFDSSGNSLWARTSATILGKKNIEEARSVTIDNYDNIIITGYTYGSDLEVDLDGDGNTLGDAEKSGSGSQDAFICKFMPDGTLPHPINE